MDMIKALTEIFEFEFLRTGLVVFLLLALLSGFLSPLVVAKKYSFIGSAISHSVLLSSTLALFFVSDIQSFSFFTLNLFFSLVMVLILAIKTRKSSVPSDGLIGLFFASTMGIGVVLQSLSKQNSFNLQDLFLGNILLLDNNDLWIALMATIFPCLFIIFNLKKWIFTIFDEENANLQGVNTALYHYGLFFLMTLTLISFLKISGTIVVNSFIIFPGIFALQIAKSYKQCFLYSVLFALFTALVSFYLANLLALPVGASLASFQFIILIILVGCKKLLFS
jgi:ABC-type Mn2+/Zn2+ transport system permease subunit